MKVLLVKPHVSLNVARSLYGLLHLEPLELEIVAGGIDPEHEVRILDLTVERAPIRTFDRAVDGFRPNVIGYTGYANQAGQVKSLAARARTLASDARQVVGGLHATLAPGDFRDVAALDWVVRGEGGTAMRTLLRHVAEGRNPPEDGRILDRRSAGFTEQADRPPPPFPDDWESIPSPRRDLVDRARYFCVWQGRPGERLPTLFPRTASLQTSRGCPYRCGFCVVPHLHGGRYIPRAVSAVVDEIAAVPETHIYFVDDEMFVKPDRAKAVARELQRRGIRKRYISWARADTICRRPDVFACWRDAGLDLLYVGIESMDDAQLDAYNKRCDVETNGRAVAILRELGIGLHAALMVQPDFSREDFLRMRRAAARLQPCETTFTVFSPPAGTSCWETNRDRFICPDPYAYYDCMHTLLPTALPLKTFYRYFAMLYLLAFRENPWRRHGVRVPWRDRLRLLCAGARFGWSLRSTFKDYDRASWKRGWSGAPERDAAAGRTRPLSLPVRTRYDAGA